MNIILPYIHELECQKRAYIKPNGQILTTTGKHKIWAKEFCIGSECKDFRSLFSKQSPNNPLPSSIIESSSLTIEQLELLKIWLQGKDNFDENLFSDFLVFISRFDKMETKSRKVISTTSPIPHIRFYNYDLMDWSIEQHAPQKLNKELGIFVPCPEEGIIFTHQDRNAEEELNDIKRNVLLKDRHYFLK